MNGIHDLGGMHGFGPVNPEKDEPVFHHDWEARVFGLFAPLSATGAFNVDEFRHAIERMGAANYLQTSYYEHWLHAFETVAMEKGILTAEELRTGHAIGESPKATPALAPEAVPKIVLMGSSARVDMDVKPKFKEGDMVVVKNMNPIIRRSAFDLGRALNEFHWGVVNVVVGGINGTTSLESLDRVGVLLEAVAAVGAN